VVPAPGASAYPYADVSLTGHGWGPGEGMGQWGALGYALGQTPYPQILSTYYGTLAGGGSTSQGALPNRWTDSTPVTVAITENAGNTVIVTSGSPFTVSGVAATFGPGTGYPAVELSLVSATATTGQWTVSGGAGCAGPDWTPLGTGPVADPVVSPVTAAAFPAASQSALGSQVLQLCYPGQNILLRGSIQGVVNSADAARTVNIVPLGQYVADVTPSESPQSWGTLGGAGPQGQPWGFQELEAQAVAVRSYVMSTYGSLQGWYGYADTCDSTCQSYPGITNENATTDAAVTDTANLAVLLPGGAATAFTQYSSSTGGYSAAGTFAAVPDLGDSVCVPGACNAHHTWQAQVPVTAIEGAYPQIGSLISVGVSQRTGLGDLGGRALAVSLQGTAQTLTVTGDAFAAQFGAFGVQSNWFAVTSQASGGIAGYWLVGSDGGVFAFGTAGYFGSMGGQHLNAPMVGMARTPDGGGYWLVGSDGGVFAFGTAGYFGSMGGRHLNAPMVGMARTPDGGGYWSVAVDGGVFAFGDAGYFGSMGGRPLNAPMVGIVATPDGGGYWTVAADGGVFAFGDAGYFGSMGAEHLNAPMAAMATTPDGLGYWTVAADGGVFCFGDAAYGGSLPGDAMRATAVALLPTVTGAGYLVVTADGQAVDFGDAPQFGDVAGSVAGWHGRLVGGALAPQ